MKSKLQFLTVAFIATTIALNSGLCFAQPAMPDLKKASPEQRAQYQTSLMKSKLNLNDSQTTKVQDINLKYAQKMQPVISGTDSRFSKARQVMSIQKQKDAELQAIFTQDQFKQYKAFEDEMRSKLKAKMQASN